MAAALYLSADAPAGYYSSCEGKTGKALLQALNAKIESHTTIAYKSLKSVYVDSDVHPDGSIWDMYSTKNWGSFSSASACGNYSVVGDCWNKEHSFPKSWFKDQSPMASDAFHIYPTDGKVNGQRSNFPYGECAHGTTLPSSGSVKALGKLGSSTFPGYSGTVFEPDDQYKGDFARSYFYMAACYNDKIASWSSDMLAGNDYPCFSSWAVNLLLKWHRQDPVSKKETDRNDAVYAHQKNRNPFIDHPELAEYIWGDKQGQSWSANPVTDPAFTLPVNNSTVTLPVTGVGIPVSTSVSLKGVALTENVTVTTSGSPFSVTPSTITAAQAMSGTAVTVTYSNTAPGRVNGTLTFASSGVSVSVNLVGEALAGLPALPATDISSESFTANWVNISGAGAKYTLDVQRQDVSVDGYPMQVNAADGSHTVEGLEPETLYTYYLTDGTISSEVISVTTAAPVPSVTFLYDGELIFAAMPDTPSDAAELLAEIDNIPGDVTVSVSAPFEVSLNKQEWGSSAVLSPGADRFYMRLGAAPAGTYYTTITATAEGYFNDDAEAEGEVAAPGASFLEDFEKDGEAAYTSTSYSGTACEWNRGGIYLTKSADQAQAHESTQAARTNKSGNRFLEMAEDKEKGAGTVTFWGKLWSKESTPASFDMSISTDHGATWEKVATVTVPANQVNGTNVYKEFSVPVNKPGKVRLKLNQTAGGRCMIDDIAISDYTVSDIQLTPAGHAYHSWDAYCVAGQLVIENHDAANHFRVYALDGTEIFSGRTGEGSRSIAVAPGLYIVAVADFSRRVLVK